MIYFNTRERGRKICGYLKLIIQISLQKKKSKEKIEIDIPCYGAEKEAYLQAMGMAYDRKNEKPLS